MHFLKPPALGQDAQALPEPGQPTVREAAPENRAPAGAAPGQLGSGSCHRAALGAHPALAPGSQDPAPKQGLAGQPDPSEQGPAFSLWQLVISLYNNL